MGKGEITKRRVTKSNDLVEAAYRLTLNEQRIVLAAIAQIDSRKPRRIAERASHTIEARDFAESFGLDLKNAYRELEDGAKRLMRRIVTTVDRKAAKRVEFNWVEKTEYSWGQGNVTLWFTPSIKPYLYELTRRFTTYDLAQIAHLRSVYAIRLYEMLKQYGSRGHRTITIDKLRDLLMLGDRYTRFNNLRQRVIDPAIEEINTTTDLSVEWRPIRENRKIVSLAFDFAQNPQQQLGFEPA